MASFIDVSQFSVEEFQSMAKMTPQDRDIALKKAAKSSYTAEEVQRVVPMTFVEELTAICLFLFGVPGAVFTLPVLTFLVAFLTKAYLYTFSFAIGISLILAVWPAPFQESSLSSWASIQILKYFSFKGLFEVPLSRDKPYILVAPPHGVFPFGNIATMIAFPAIMGFSFRALAASAALRFPLFRQLLATIGATDASRKNAEKVEPKNE